MKVKDINIIVTGASEGIGRAAAVLLSQHGARVILVARSKEKLDSLAKELPGSSVIPADMSEPEEVREMIEKAHEECGRIDVLVNNAGRGIYGPVEKTDIASYKDIIDLNIIGPLVAMQSVIPLMRTQGGGTIVNISSMVSKAYYPSLGAYASTKYALNALSLTARDELAKDDIVISVVYPGLTDTNFGKNAIKSDEGARAMESRQRSGMPQADSPEHVATRILFAIEHGDAEVFMHV